MELKRGIDVIRPAPGAARDLTGFARGAREAREREAIASEEARLRARVLARSREVAERQIEAMRGADPEVARSPTKVSRPTSGHVEG